MLDIFKAVLLSIVEGLTEFIPVSSTGHMIIVGDLINFKSDIAETFEIFIQLGAILAVVYLYPHRFLNLLKSDVDSRRSFEGREGIKRLALASFPAFFLGAFLHSTIKEYLFHPYPVAFGLFTGGLAIIIIESRYRVPKVVDLNQLTYKQVFLIGIAQCLALWPGMSRSASTIIGGLLVGLSRTVAAEFSFLLAVPVMCGAVGYDLLKSYSVITVSTIPIFAIGFFISFVVAILAVKLFMSLLSRIDMKPFGYYRLVLGGFIIVLFELGVIE
jgi:undecaprenyl-diphosphatase